MIPLIDLKAQYLSIKEQIDESVSSVLRSGQFVSGEEVASLEKDFAAYCGTRFGIAVNSGTSALHLSLLAAQIGPGTEVITVPFTFVATVASICYSGADPVFVDIDPRSFTMDITQIEAAITPRTRAILPVHLYGQPADMDPILELAKHYGITVIEDAAQAHGAKYKGRPVGSIGDLGCFSFYPTKNLGACGEGGIVVTSNAEFECKLRSLRDWGQEGKYNHVLKGYNCRMDEIQAAILRVKLDYLNSWIETRRRIAFLYNNLLNLDWLKTPEEMPYASHVYHIYAIRNRFRNALKAWLERRSIQTGIHYPIPVHLQKAYSYLGHEPGSFPISEEAAEEVLSLPMYPELEELSLVNIVDCIHKVGREIFPSTTTIFDA